MLSDTLVLIGGLGLASRLLFPQPGPGHPREPLRRPDEIFYRPRNAMPYI